MTDSQRIPWSRFSFESALIVASILAALAIDSWWANRQLAAEEDDLLLQLQAEFQINLSILDETRNRHEGVVVAATAILELTGPDVTASDFDVGKLESDIFAILRWWTFDPQTGVLDGIISTGKLGIISSGSLRTTLAAWPSVIRDLEDDEDYAVNFTHEVLEFMNQNAVTRDITYKQDIGKSTFSSDYEALLRNPVFENIVMTRRNLEGGALTEYDSATAFVEGVLVQIDGQFNSR